jgi:riboflavin synthase
VFTGLVEEIGVIKKVESSGGGYYITIGAARVLDGTKSGDSINIDGACQTVTAVSGGDFTVFCSKVTIGITTLAGASAGRRVNLERAMTMQSRFGGHVVQGHVDGTGVIRNVTRDQKGISLEIAAPEDILRYVTARGSIAVDGISLTVVSAAPGGFSLYLIPETMAGTTLSAKRPGDKVNLEADIFAKYIERLLESGKAVDGNAGDAAIRKKLAEEGYI